MFGVLCSSLKVPPSPTLPRFAREGALSGFSLRYERDCATSAQTKTTLPLSAPLRSGGGQGGDRQPWLLCEPPHGTWRSSPLPRREPAHDLFICPRSIMSSQHNKRTLT